MTSGGRGKRKASIAALAAISVLFSAGPAQGSETGTTVVTGASATSAGHDLFGQSFTVPDVPGDDFFHSLFLPRVLRGAAGGDGTPLYISAADANGIPTGLVLFQATIPAGVQDGPRTFYPNITVTPGGKYAWWTEVDSPPVYIGRGSTDTYPQGIRLEHVTAGAWQGFTDFDFAFLAKFSDGRGPTETSIACPATGTIGVGLACPVAVTSPDPFFPATPTGTVGFSSVGGSGNFTGCGTLNGSGQCTVTYTPSSAGDHTVFGQYLGSATYLGSAGSDGVSVSRRSSSQSDLDCTPSAVMVGQAVTCSATVTDADAGNDTTPTGSVAWQSSGAGSFSPSSTCPLTPTPTFGFAECASVTFVPSAPGIHSFTAAYSGDGTHLPVGPQAAGSVTVQAAPGPPAPPGPAGPSAECDTLRKQLKSLKKQLRKADGAKKAKVRRKIARTKARLAALGC